MDVPRTASSRYRFKYVIFGAKALIENFVETGSKKHPSKFDFGPINTMITSNYVNGTRFRLSAA